MDNLGRYGKRLLHSRNSDSVLHYGACRRNYQVVFKLGDMKVNDIASSFRSGASDLLGAAMVVGMARASYLFSEETPRPMPLF